MCLRAFVCAMWYGILLFVLYCFCCDVYLCAPRVIYNALLYGVFCCELVEFVCAFLFNHVFVCLVCDLFVMLSGLWCVLVYVYVGLGA